jgi:hypothetical protein
MTGCLSSVRSEDRGSTAIGASVDNLLELARERDDPDRRRRRLSNSRCRFAAERDDRWLRIDHDEVSDRLLVDSAGPCEHNRLDPRSAVRGAIRDVLGDEPQ